MADDYLLGVILAILGGVVNQLGAVFQKKVVNNIPKESRDEKFMRTLIKSPLWITGLIFIMVLSAIFLLSSQAIIGGALGPGLAASGMIVLVLGSVFILGERINKRELIGIISIMIGILFIGLSELSIEGSLDHFLDINFILRISIFTLILFILWMGCRWAGKKYEKGKTLFLAFSAGLPFAIGNLWLQSFTLALVAVFGGTADLLGIIVFIVSAIIVTPTSFAGIYFVQEAFAHGDASKIMPLQGIPQQLAPVLLYFVVYLNAPPTVFSIYFMSIGIALILLSGFLLAERQAKFEAIE
jgi:drug/metabolite transporter (DMT)-like permease